MRTPAFPLLVLLVLVCVAGCREKQAAKPTPLKVQVVTVVPREIPIHQEWIGTLEGYPNAQIHAQVAGYLQKQIYHEGSAVKKGELLFEIDPRPFQAALDQALAKQKQDEAMLEKTDLDVKRFTPLAKNQAISRQQLDDAVQAHSMAEAAVNADKAAVHGAELNLDFTHITSPVDGIAGLAQAQIGDLVGPTTAALTTVSTINPIRAYFQVTEQFYLSFFRPAAGGESTHQRLLDMPLKLILADGSVYPAPGRWIVTGRNVDSSTGTLEAAAEFENPGNFLRPGQYALIRARTEIRSNAILIPQRAVTELQGSWQVAIVDATNIAHIRSVHVGPQIGTEWLIQSGLEANDRVVAEGTQKVKDGDKVEPVAYVPVVQEKKRESAQPTGGKVS